MVSGLHNHCLGSPHHPQNQGKENHLALAAGSLAALGGGDWGALQGEATVSASPTPLVPLSIPPFPVTSHATSRTFTSAYSAAMLHPDWGGEGLWPAPPAPGSHLLSAASHDLIRTTHIHTFPADLPEDLTTTPLPLDRAWGNTEKPHWHPSDHNMVPGMNRSDQ